ncbi:MAG: hypothetical protein ABIH49_02300 [archaeon]
MRKYTDRKPPELGELRDYSEEQKYELHENRLELAARAVDEYIKIAGNYLRRRGHYLVETISDFYRQRSPAYG